MKNPYFKYTINSVSFKLLFLILVTVVPLVALLIYNNNQSRSILLSQVDDTHRNMLQSYVAQLDNQLSTALSYTVNLAAYENDPQIIALSQDEAAVQYAKVRLINDMEEKLLSNNYLDGYFIRIEEQDGHITFINSTNWKHAITSSKALEDFVSSSIENGFTNTAWNLCSLNDSEYLFLMTDSGNSVWAGAYVNLTQLLKHFSPGSVPDSSLYFCAPDELPSFAEALSPDMRLVSYDSSVAEVTMTETFSRSEILNSLPFLQKYTVLVAVLLIVLVALLIVLIHHVVSKPLLKLTGAMYHIQNGELDYHIPETNSSTEIKLVNSTFNRMVSEVQHLKINVYEEQLKVQKSQLRNLQMQIKPHFLINSLNLVYNLIETKQLQLARRLIQYSIDYFRYMVRVDEDLVPLNEEIDHVRAYLEIQSIRYEKRFTYSISVNPMIDDMLVPPVMIQNLVENSMKYALSLNTPTDIQIKITSFEKDYFPYARIIISDTGQGYPEEYLNCLNAGEKIVKKDGAHIGIRNTVQRLKILFGEKASWRFYNDNGAVGEFILPATFDESQEDEVWE